MGGRGEEPAMTPDLRYDQEGEKRRAKIINGMVKEQETCGGETRRMWCLSSPKKRSIN